MNESWRKIPKSITEIEWRSFGGVREYTSTLFTGGTKVTRIKPRCVNVSSNEVPTPLVISFSGGRSSGYLLGLLLKSFNGVLPKDVVICFQNTGFELPQTLDFVQRCHTSWNVPITWIEYDSDSSHRLKIVSYNEASRSGEPFIDLFSRVHRKRNKELGLLPLPNPVSRICTSELKIRLQDRYLRKVLGWDRYFAAVGLRYDEPSRVGRQRASNSDDKIITRIHPLFDAAVTQKDVYHFWTQVSDFDLNLEPGEGNCDFCFMKSFKTIKYMMRKYPERVQPWISLESVERGRPGPSQFRIDRVSYAQILERVQRGDNGAEDENPFLNSCSCTD